MQLIKPGINLDFVGKIKYAITFSVILIIVSIGSVIYHGGLNPGIDFAGGSVIQVKFSKNISADQIRGALKSTRLQNSTIQQFGTNEFLIRTSESFSDQTVLAANVEQPLAAAFSKDFEMQKQDIIYTFGVSEYLEDFYFNIFFENIFNFLDESGRLCIGQPMREDEFNIFYDLGLDLKIIFRD